MSNSHDFTYHRLILSVIMAALALSAFPAFCADAKGNPQGRKILMTPQRIENELKEICSAKYDSPKKNEAANRLRNFKISESQKNASYETLYDLTVLGAGGVLEYLFQNGANMSVRREKDGVSLLEAVFKYSPELLPLYVETFHADLNQKDKGGRTPIIYALALLPEGKTCSVVKYMVKHGAKANIRFGDGFTPLFYCKDLDTMRYLVENQKLEVNSISKYSGITPLSRVCSMKRKDLRGYLMKHGADINLPNSQSPLLFAALKKDADSIKEYLQLGADINHVSGFSRYTVLCSLAAARDNMEDMIKILLENGADPNIADSAGNTPAHLAVHLEKTNLLEIFLNSPKMKVNAEPLNGIPLLPYAIKAHKNNSVKLLIDKYGELNWKDGRGWTPMRWAIAANNINAQQLLIEKNGVPDWSEKDCYGRSYEDEASFRANESMKRFLMKNGMKEIKPYFKLSENSDLKDIKDLSQSLKLLGSPALARYSGNKQKSYARNIWVLHPYQNKIYIGCGNSSNGGPAVGSGPVPVYSYDTKTASFSEEWKVPDEQIDVFRTFSDGCLYIPGHDPTESWELGNFYRKKTDGAWEKMRTMPNGVHNYDMAEFDNKIFSCGYGIAQSSDRGKTMTLQDMPGGRFYSFFPFKDALFCVASIDISSYKNRAQYACYSTKDGLFHACSSKGDFLLPDTVNESKDSSKAVRPTPWNDCVFFIGGQEHNDHQTKPYGVYCAKHIGSELYVCKVNVLPEEITPWDLTVIQDELYILASQKHGNDRYLNSVWKITKDNVVMPLFFFYTGTFARSFTRLNQDFYFGLGTEIKNSGYFRGNTLIVDWSPDELSEDAGNIYKLHYSL